MNADLEDVSMDSVVGWRVYPTSLRASAADAPLATLFTEGRSHCVRHANAAFGVLARRSPRDVVGRAVSGIVAAEGLQQLLDRVLETGLPGVASDVIWKDDADAAVRYVTVIVRPVANDETGAPGLLVELLDVTEQVVARASSERISIDGQLANEALVVAALKEQATAEAALREKERWNALVENLVEGVTVLDGRGQAILVNPVGRALLDLDTVPPKEYAACVFHSLDDVVIAPEHHPAARVLAGERFVDEELVYHRADGSRAHILFSGSHVRDEDGRVVLAINTYRDVTASRALEETREEYVALITHDLRSPLQSLLGNSELLQESLNAGPGGAERQLKFARVIEKATQRLAAMVEELYESSKLEAGTTTLALAPTAPTALAAELLDHIAPRDRERVHVEGALDNLPAVHANAPRIGRALVNLVTNALKYSGPASKVVVSLERTEQEIVFAVRDQGPGIDPQDVGHLFEKYRRGKGTAKREGLGLGLYISRRIVEAHGGRIWAETMPGSGSTFRIALPLAPIERATR